MNCMVSLGFKNDERNAVFQVVAAVLHLGNLQFNEVQRDSQEGAEVAGPAEVRHICGLLGIEVDALHSVLHMKTLEDPLTKKVIHRPQTVENARQTRHSMAKVAYGRLFDWLVWRVNQS